MLPAPSHAGFQSAVRVRRRPSSLTVFAARMNSLSLQNCNLIIIPHCLSKFPALSKLDLSRNQLESVDSAFILRHLPQLLNLDLSNNRISNVAQIQVREYTLIPQTTNSVHVYANASKPRSLASTLASLHSTSPAIPCNIRGSACCCFRCISYNNHATLCGQILFSNFFRSHFIPFSQTTRRR